MPITVYPVTQDFVAEIGDVNLATLLSAEDDAAIKAAFWKYAVLIFPDQHLDANQHIEFASRFGRLEVALQVARTGEGNLRLRPELVDPSNLDADDRISAATSRLRMTQLANRLWHTDSSFRHVPAQASLLYARTIAPVGGHTEFADLRAAWEALPEAMRTRIDPLVVEHWFMASRAKVGFTQFTVEERVDMPPVQHLLVRTIPESGRRSLYLASHATRVIGLPDGESRRLLEELTGHATRREFVYTHRWRPFDLVVWDNRCTMYRGTDFDDLRWRRDLQRATVSDVGNTRDIEAALAACAAGGGRDARARS